MNSHQTDWEKNIIDNADSYSIMEWRPLGKSTKTIVKTYEEAIRWILEAEELINYFDKEPDYICHSLGLSYDKEYLFKTKH